jgi:hypothetical protein
MIAVAIFSISMGVTGTWVLAGPGKPAHIWDLIACLMLACVLSASVAVLFSTILNPLFATLATAITLGVPAVATLQFGSHWGGRYQLFVAGSIAAIFIREKKYDPFGSDGPRFY